MPIGPTQEKGLRAESLAAHYFESQGFEIVERNYRHKKSEVDLIILLDNLLVFVEVKYRRNDKYGNPEDFVSKNQARSIIEAADNYIYSITWEGNIRFDIIAVNAQEELEHFEDAFY